MKAIFQSLREGRPVPDQEFDQLFPEEIRRLSEIHWTPIDIARRAAELLVVIRLDGSVEYSELSYLELIRWVQQKLNSLPVGTRVVTYHGFGGEMPPNYSLRFLEAGGGDFLRLWVKDT